MTLVRRFEKHGSWLFKHRSKLPVILIVAGMIVYYFTVRNTGKYEYFDMWKFIALGVCLFGLFIRAIVIGHTPKNTSGRNKSKQIADELNTSGIYSIVRNPLYLGNFFMWFGICIITQNIYFIIIFILIYWLYYERIIFAEEQFLVKKFGKKYIKWASKTPAFIPNFKSWEKNKLPFSLKNVLKREYNGFLNVFLIILLLDIEEKLIIGDKFNFFTIWIILFFAALAVFITLRTLKKKTKVLDVEGR